MSGLTIAGRILGVTAATATVVALSGQTAPAHGPGFNGFDRVLGSGMALNAIGLTAVVAAFGQYDRAWPNPASSGTRLLGVVGAGLVAGSMVGAWVGKSLLKPE